MSCAAFTVSACLYCMLSPTFFINVFYLDLFCIHVCVDDVIEKKKKDNEHFRLNFRKDVQTVFNAIPCNPFQLDPLCSINDFAYTFPESVGETIKIVLSEGVTKVKSFISGRLISQKTPIAAKIKKEINFLY